MNTPIEEDQTIIFLCNLTGLLGILFLFLGIAAKLG